MTEKSVVTHAHAGQRVSRWLLLLVLSLSMARAGNVEDGLSAYREGDFESAYRLLAPAATIDNPDLQNLVALMLYMGRGTDPNAAAAHELFHSAAMIGSVEARRNLGILHTLGAPGVDVNFEEARIWFATAQVSAGDEPPAGAAGITGTIDALISPNLAENGNGRDVFLTFCSGCHGFSGMHFFKYAPSFAMGQRMTKSDAELMTSIRQGKGLMPSWEGKLPLSDLEDALAYLRLLSIQTAYGMDTAGFNAQPELFFIFYPYRPGDPDSEEILDLAGD